MSFFRSSSWARTSDPMINSHMLCQLSYRGICQNPSSLGFCSGNSLLSRAVSHQVSSTLRTLTSVFGMGTGVSSSLSSPDFLPSIAPSKLNNTTTLSLMSFFTWLSPRPISTDQLNTLLHLHLRPINHIVFMGSYCSRMGNLILEGASRLDAFSVYPVRTSLPCYALGRTTDAQLVRPTRSSRTKVSSPQISYARDR